MMRSLGPRVSKLLDIQMLLDVEGVGNRGTLQAMFIAALFIDKLFYFCIIASKQFLYYIQVPS